MTSPASQPTRERILAAANELFYVHGIRATSADRIIEIVGITKVTFYRHFRTKGELVVAYLEAQSAAERAWITGARDTQDAGGPLRAIAVGIGAASCRPGFRGCAFINAAAEFPDPQDPVRIAVEAHRSWILHQFTAIAADAGVDDPAAVGHQLVLLRDGAMVSGYLTDPTDLSTWLAAAFDSVMSAALQRLS